MATLADDIQTGIVNVLKGSDFNGTIPNDRVGAGLTFDGSGDLGAYGRAVIRYVGVAPVRTFDTSAEIEHTFEIVWQYDDNDDLASDLIAVEEAMLKNFADDGETLRAAMDSTALQNGGAIRVALSPAIPVVEPQNDGGLYQVVRAWQITVTAWRAN